MSTFGESPEAYESEAERESEYEREREKRSKERALTFLTHTKRAESVEAAERYLERMNEIKEKLVQFTRAQILDEDGWQGINDPEYPHITFGYDRADADDIDRITVKNIDRTDPELWKLRRQIQPSYHDFLPEGHGGSASGVLDRLTINLNGPSVEIHPEFAGKGETFLEELRKYLSEEDLTFLRNEYRFTAQDLERSLRAVADQIAKDPEGSSLMKNFLKAQDSSGPERTMRLP
jgi:plasmid stabilization system protein ParE